MEAKEKLESEGEETSDKVVKEIRIKCSLCYDCLPA